ncbi:heterokaryon incompatibility protein [Colletotrichum musicola]|uniref:Heterokaryon incompatibility protein n=1 Tax=Colletotrichum musicola TaxID=2175873 RepID=A0A8H6U731_9PEZI|nr:heterokaryon incompatibility protein [Colletotrichum musicola]
MDRDYIQIETSNIPSSEELLLLEPAGLCASLPLLTDFRCIRVIDVSHNGDRNAPLRGSLRVVNLKDSPQFTALSYVWGDCSGNEYTLHCNGCDIPITKNCRDAIASLRSQHADLTIWIDAVCINQGGEKEKTSQMQMMEEIYTWAQTAFVWLGNGNTKSVNAMECLRLASTFRTELPGIPWSDTRGRRTISQDYFHIVVVLLVLHSRRLARLKKNLRLEDLDDVLGRKWIERAWKFHEIILASNPVIVCGDEAISWGHLLQAIDYLRDTQGFFQINFWQSLRGIFAYNINGEIALPELSETSKAIRSLASFGAWRALSNLWTLTYRPNCWNDKEIRQLPRGLMSRQSSSVRDYQERISMPRAWHYTEIVMIAITFVMILTFTAYLVAIIVATRGSTFLGVLLIPVMLLEAMCLGLSIPVVATFFAVSVLFGALAMLYATRTEPHFYSDEYASGMPLAGLVRALRERRATVAKDKAFALHGVLHGLNISHSKADYDMSLGEVYRRLFLDLLRFKPATINLLVDVGPASLPGVPSWVPDWSAAQDRPWLKAESVYGHLDLYYRNLPEPQMKIEDAMLGLWTVLKCTVKFCAPSPPAIDEDASLQETLQTVWRWVSVMTGSASRNLAIRDVISACVPDAQQAHISALCRCPEVASRETDGRQRSGGISRGALERLKREDPEILGLAAECHRRIVDSNGRLFVSRSGLVGFDPPRTAEGDTIALLRGVAVPMVLRRAEGAGEGDRYTVVGPAYVSGLMDLTEFNTSVHGADWTAVYLV